LGANSTQAARWRRNYRQRFVEEEVASLEQSQELQKIEQMLIALPNYVASPLSINSLRKKLEVSHKSVSKWLDIAERIYGIFRVYPFQSSKLNSLKKEAKHYHWDWALVDDPAARFENFIASHLLKWVHYKQDAEGLDYDLHYFRDSSQREVDFIISNKAKPIQAIEVKLADGPVSKHLIYLKNKFPNMKAIQVSLKGKKHYVSSDGVHVMPWLELLPNLA